MALRRTGLETAAGRPGAAAEAAVRGARGARARLRCAHASASCSRPAAQRAFRSRAASVPRWPPIRRRTISSAPLRCMTRVRIATPEGPGTTNGAATSRRPPTPSPPPRSGPTPSPLSTRTLGEGHAFDTRTLVPYRQGPPAAARTLTHAHQNALTRHQPPPVRNPFLAGAAHDADLAEEADVDTAWLAPLNDLLRRAAEAGHGPRSVSVFIERLRKGA